MLEARPKGHCINIGYVLVRRHWGQGFMPEAVQTFADLALSHPRYYRVEATCDVENVPSARTLQKSGFCREGPLARHTVHPNVSAEPRACWIYAKFR
jgi:ribosomal-protein-alanine N-acetyltransferase